MATAPRAGTRWPRWCGGRRPPALLRGDLTAEDLPVISFAIAGILETTRDDVPDAWRRHVALLLEGCRAGAATSPLPPAPEPRALHRAMLRSARRRQTR